MVESTTPEPDVTTETVVHGDCENAKIAVAVIQNTLFVFQVISFVSLCYLPSIQIINVYEYNSIQILTAHEGNGGKLLSPR